MSCQFFFYEDILWAIFKSICFSQFATCEDSIYSFIIHLTASFEASLRARNNFSRYNCWAFPAGSKVMMSHRCNPLQTANFSLGAGLQRSLRGALTLGEGVPSGPAFPGTPTCWVLAPSFLGTNAHCLSSLEWIVSVPASIKALRLLPTTSLRQSFYTEHERP